MVKIKTRLATVLAIGCIALLPDAAISQQAKSGTMDSAGGYTIGDRLLKPRKG